MATEQEYLEDSSLWGDYKYVTLEQIINDYLASRDQDDYTFNTPRTKVIYQAKRGLRELYYDVLQEVKAIELDLGPNLQVVLPQDYVAHTRISWLDDNNELQILSENTELSISRRYLQDSDAEILFDVDGNILEADGVLNADSGNGIVTRYTFCRTGFTPNLNRAKYKPDGSYRIDKDAGVIRFDAPVEGKTLVIEYISDGLYSDTEDMIRVHKFAEQALSDYIYLKLIERRRNVPANEKHRARKEYFNSRRIAKRRINQASRNNLIKAMKGSSVWIKD